MTDLHDVTYKFFQFWHCENKQSEYRSETIKNNLAYKWTLCSVLLSQTQYTVNSTFFLIVGGSSEQGV